MAEHRLSAAADRVRCPTLGLSVGLFVAAAGLAIGLRPLADNSFFTHLATGRLILEHGSVPSHDPYTFTAAGEPWVVQSWLASWLYATAEAIGGAVGLRLVIGIIAAVLAMLVWRLARPAEGIVARLAVAGLALGVGAELWAERPFMLGLVGLACTVLAADGHLDPRWLLPVGWVWVNSHGSFPLGIAYLAVAAVGARLDARSVAPDLRALGWALAGVLLGAVGPLGLQALTFPVDLLGRQEVLRNVIEWRAPTFDTLSQRLFILQLGVAVVLLVRRPTFRSGLVMSVFGAAALLSARNIPVASLVFVPAMATALGGAGSLRADQRPSIARPLAVVGAVTLAAMAVVRLDQEDYDLRRYPLDALAFVDETAIDVTEHHLATEDVVGNVQELVHRPDGRVFYDDRFDMFPDAVTDAHLALIRGAPSLGAELARYDIELIVWDRSSAVGQRLVVDPGWRVLYSDERAIVVCRRGAPVGGSVGRC